MGMVRTCTKFSKVKGGVLRCAKFKEQPGHPVCDKRLKDGGHSPGLVRKMVCAQGAPAAMKTRRKKRRNRR